MSAAEQYVEKLVKDIRTVGTALENTKINEARVREHYLTQNDQLRAFVQQVAGDTRWGISARQLLRRLDK